MTDRTPPSRKISGRLGRVAQFVKRLFDPPTLTRIPSYNEIHDSWTYRLPAKYQGSKR